MSNPSSSAASLSSGPQAGPGETTATTRKRSARRRHDLHKASPVSRLLAGIPGIGPIGAVSLSLTVEAGQFRSARHFAAWPGLVPREHSTGGKQRLGGISRQGNERLRQLLVVGAMAVVRAAARPAANSVPAWLRSLLERRPRKVAAVALANKMARVVWAMMTSGEAYRPQPIIGSIAGWAARRCRWCEGSSEMAIGRPTSERTRGVQRPHQAATLFGARSRNLSGPAVKAPRHKAGHMTALAPHATTLPPLHQRGRPHMDPTDKPGGDERSCAS